VGPDHVIGESVLRRFVAVAVAVLVWVLVGVIHVAYLLLFGLVYRLTDPMIHTYLMVLKLFDK
jgi:hypothetical protein